MAGYAVKATGDIIVNGVVEAASLTADGSIVLTNGIHGEGKGRLKAGGDIVAKFIQASTVTADGCVTSGSILNSKVTANDSILVLSQKGFVSGGELRAGALITAKVVGSAASGTNTLLEVGPHPADMKEYRDLEKLLVEKRIEQKKLYQASDLIKQKSDNGESLPPELSRLVNNVPFQISMVESEINQLLKRYYQIKAEVEKNDVGKITVESTVYEGTKIVISNVSYYIRDAIAECQFVREGSEIKAYAL